MYVQVVRELKKLDPELSPEIYYGKIRTFGAIIILTHFLNAE